MSYTLYTTPTGQRSLRKLPAATRKQLLKKLQKLRQDPLSCPRLQGELRYLRSLHTRIQAADYRIAYEVDTKQRHILIHLAATRENFYRKLRKMIRRSAIG